MILITTAFAEEYRAVSRALRNGCIAHWPCEVIMTGIGPRAARRGLSQKLERSSDIELVVSIGIAGALTTQHRLFDRLLIGSVTRQSSPPVRRASKSEPLQLLPALERLHDDIRTNFDIVDLVSVPHVVLSAREKSQLAELGRADIGDMETHAVASVCQQRGLPWLGGRIVSDTAGESLPAWVVALPKLIKSRRWRQTSWLVATHPQDLPCLIRLGIRMRRLQPALTKFTTDIVSHVLPA